MDRPVDVIPLDALTREPSHEPGAASPHKLLDRAEVIYAVDARSQRDILVYGREKLRRIADSDVPEGAQVIRVGIGAEPQKLTRLLALIQQAKGSHDYRESA
jgi:hypothetical protein